MNRRHVWSSFQHYERRRELVNVGERGIEEDNADDTASGLCHVYHVCNQNLASVVSLINFALLSHQKRE
ncbi:hypothetical protein M378DRAFT_171817 [Amanita muscaria Koide BX008]|uniref:Uncharacterized protein n=1 Tax=Amanita muscaria (strain Koide BX008) TaxID=946122 RepID=A0A0C2WL25_AMAMK|nr:hypothetical protein M378DRAFT_171817 [Amanita muscaria Koide BX008]